ncbi:MAG: hypothetical protein VX024_02300, partial [SAR324 cluster bacterium]|nr:hypothetical protein [SAR324 cluster bacterium]
SFSSLAGFANLHLRSVSFLLVGSSCRAMIDTPSMLYEVQPNNVDQSKIQLANKIDGFVRKFTTCDGSQNISGESLMPVFMGSSWRNSD